MYICIHDTYILYLYIFGTLKTAHHPKNRDYVPDTPFVTYAEAYGTDTVAGWDGGPRPAV